VSEAEDGEDAEPPVVEGEAPAPDMEDDDKAVGDPLAELADVLTATADRLKGITLGRGFSKSKIPPKKPMASAMSTGAPASSSSQQAPQAHKPRGRGRGRFRDRPKGRGGRGGFKLKPGETFADLKKRTACSACGRIGHWRGDPSCPKDPSKSVCVCAARALKKTESS
jgi:hypothetical protein